MNVNHIAYLIKWSIKIYVFWVQVLVCSDVVAMRREISITPMFFFRK